THVDFSYHLESVYIRKHMVNDSYVNTVVKICKEVLFPYIEFHRVEYTPATKELPYHFMHFFIVVENQHSYNRHCHCRYCHIYKFTLSIVTLIAGSVLLSSYSF